ncbi:MAG: thioredoxin [Bacteroidales bacterium]|nr:thioredoxin [Bacteroidales bacterium]
MKKLFLPLIIALAFGITACNQPTGEDQPAEEMTEVPSTLLNDNGNTPSVTAVEDTEEKVISTVQVLNTKQFEEKICDLNNPKGFQYKGKLPAVVDFYADWCGPCRMVAPILVELAEEYAGQIIIYKVNIDKCPEVSQAFEIQSIPTILYMKPNAQPTATVGALSKDELKQVIEDSLLK